MSNFTENVKKYLPYLEDLRRRLYRLVILFVVVFVAGFLSSGFFLGTFVSYFDIPNVLIATTSPFQFANIAMDVGFFFAIIITLPMLMCQLFLFVAPALTRKEKNSLLFSVPVSLVLFLGGFAYGFFVLHYSFGLLAKLNESLGIRNIWDIGSFLSQLFITSSLLGIVFQFPIVLTFLFKMGLLSVDFLRQKRRLAYFLVFVLVSLLPPTDGLSLLAMGLPLVVLYEVTILINRNTKKICLD